MTKIERLHTGVRMTQAVIHGGTVYLAGQVGTPGDTVSKQTEQILAQIDALLAESNSSKSNLLSVTIWLSDIARFDEMNAVWDSWIAGCEPPARATSEARLANPGLNVEFIVTAARN